MDALRNLPRHPRAVLVLPHMTWPELNLQVSGGKARYSTHQSTDGLGPAQITVSAQPSTRGHGDVLESSIRNSSRIQISLSPHADFDLISDDNGAELRVSTDLSSANIHVGVTGASAANRCASEIY